MKITRHLRGRYWGWWYLDRDGFRPERVRWDSKPPELDIRINGRPLSVNALENVIANALSSDFRSKGKRAPLFSTRYGVARRVTLQLAADVERQDRAPYATCAGCGERVRTDTTTGRHRCALDGGQP